MMLAQVTYLLSLLAMGALARLISSRRASRMRTFFRWLEAWFGLTVVAIGAWIVDARVYPLGWVYTAIVSVASLGVASSAVVCWVAVLRRIRVGEPAAREIDDALRWLADRERGRARILALGAAIDGG